MQRTLWLIRHGHSQAPRPGLSDFDRRLDARGERDLARWLGWLEKQSLPSITWLHSSTAARALATANGLNKYWQSPIVESSGLYLADPYTLLDALRATPEEVAHAALVGHNPGISQLANLLLQPDPNQAAEPTATSLIELPTLGVLCLTFSCPWFELRQEVASLEFSTSAKGLADQNA